MPPLPVFLITYHAGGFSYQEEVGSPSQAEAEGFVRRRLAEPEIRVEKNGKLLLLRTALIGAVEISPYQDTGQARVVNTAW